MAFYGVAEVAKKMENPFGWEAPSHDLSQLVRTVPQRYSNPRGRKILVQNVEEEKGEDQLRMCALLKEPV